MTQSNPSVGDIVRINDTSVGSKHGKQGRIIRVPNSSMPLEGSNRFRVELAGGDSYVTRFARDLEFLDAETASASAGGGSSTIPKPKAVRPASGVSEVLGNTIDENKANAILTARVEAGKTLLLQATERLRPLLPAVVAEHAGHPMFSLAVANLVAFSQKQWMPGNAKAAVVADCVMKAAMLEAGSSLALPEKINDLINNAIGGLDFSALGMPGKSAKPE